MEELNEWLDTCPVEYDMVFTISKNLQKKTYVVFKEEE
tara:strand:- start:125 stop:238 length:114 start_codon:yes stop_codon:yes gene_type:complete